MAYQENPGMPTHPGYHSSPPQHGYQSSSLGDREQPGRQSGRQAGYQPDQQSPPHGYQSNQAGYQPQSHYSPQEAGYQTQGYQQSGNQLQGKQPSGYNKGFVREPQGKGMPSPNPSRGSHRSEVSYSQRSHQSRASVRSSANGIPSAESKCCLLFFETFNWEYLADSFGKNIYFFPFGMGLITGLNFE
ncbi:hypothetical protein DPMN_189446 [Dreissena polymorpha]|uniref:Uncharacterized protein n=1 Tax=Dreissena polymorpha TaxID=45954 RepID=A0A9D4IAU2_DREPO|nr:hypothetical protein DPMN_189446 [Dreissena polymorpha]